MKGTMRVGITFLQKKKKNEVDYSPMSWTNCT